MKQCSVEGCTKPHLARGWCYLHYHRWQKLGDPLAPVRRRADTGAPQRFIEDVLSYDGNDCLFWPFAKRTGGTGVFGLHGTLVNTARYICERTHGAPPMPEYEAAHSCGKGHLSCLTPRHLSWKTHSENEADKLIHGTHNRGENHNMVKLTANQVREIRAFRKAKLPASILAAQYGVSLQAIYDISQRRTWKWLD
jgi:hypothetical protein